jgi:hypothetical protein
MTDYVDDSLVEKLWHELDGQVSRQRIAGAVTEIAAKFERATVRGFVPIFIHRRALEQLKGSLASQGHGAVGSAPADDE